MWELQQYTNPCSWLERGLSLFRDIQCVGLARVTSRNSGALSMRGSGKCFRSLEQSGPVGSCGCGLAPAIIVDTVAVMIKYYNSRNSDEDYLPPHTTTFHSAPYALISRILPIKTIAMFILRPKLVITSIQTCRKLV
jgi:hypothetical protein